MHPKCIGYDGSLSVSITLASDLQCAQQLQAPISKLFVRRSADPVTFTRMYGVNCVEGHCINTVLPEIAA